MCAPPRLTAVLFVLTLACLAIPSASAAAAPASSSFVGKVNKVRASHGLTKLTSSASLRGSSRGYARWMLRRDYFGHRARIQASQRFALRGEVLARTPARDPSPGAIVNAWLASPAHRAVLLNPRYRYVGIGLAEGRLAGRRTTLLVGHFGAR